MTMNSLATSPLPATATMSQLGSISNNCPGTCENQALSNDPCWRSPEVYDGSFGWEKTLKNGLGQRTNFVLACWDLLGFVGGQTSSLKSSTLLYWVYWLCSDSGCIFSIQRIKKYHQLLVRLVVCRGCKAKVWSERQLPLVGLITSCRSKQIEADFRGLGRIVLNLDHLCLLPCTAVPMNTPDILVPWHTPHYDLRLPSQLESA